ncbi:1,6-anhydro-N-acetylmuramyl-L-alanine amidase AmpD [Amantichitinum ursilacus]|uniref:1,6-anhydro-N-acetylmuramyl-L-alanine amidase AmpD n=1 Tax=Amantichitinum ursilacus TaxID=857265 RepID=A0A0N0XJZ7_9NEIS|nr:1,6-anhydro-N-acetylmuramyl-L-alanine amidase AmpD [Amantichitinum ursilacus]KPC54100.1 1,6-anhydro-N-acetylmuramyl-L-alanine amidase AmpD [Amantichitinum ursilacus]
MNAFDAAGWYANARHVPSPNQSPRPDGVAVDVLVLHNISLPPGQFGGDTVEQLFTNSLAPTDPLFADLGALRVSAHFFIRRDGAVLQFVPVLQKAFHAGVSHWRGRDSCNDFSVGIELEGTDHIAYTEPQYAALIELAAHLTRFCGLRCVVGHNDIAPLRKTDPGPYFDWRRIYVALPQLEPE